MSDLISRQAAIDAADRADYTGLAVEDVKKVTDEVVKEIKKLPSAQPERKTGKWIYDGDCYICNKCGTTYSWWADSQTSNYCPNCGCRMKEGE